ncbi:16S rRNA (guanine(527)-N(7))-methyltransferase RsmG [Candidatus Babeliales bacterium]|nr:16S rRNA (guanine(527)-N(7))-methyltransferase RsmG [Candidatus Babeliales bacterium]
MSKAPRSAETIWPDFAKTEKLSDHQLSQFQRYEALLSERNKETNLTAIKDLLGIVRQHFQDSLILRKFVDLDAISSIADVGTGAGFPAIPLKILFPHLKVVLIEVNKKKQAYLADLISILELENVEICDLDWRTFLRKTSGKIDLFVTRAAIEESELCRMFKPSCEHKNATLVYWAAELWECNKFVAHLVKRTENYKMGQRNRKLIFFGL